MSPHAKNPLLSFLLLAYLSYSYAELIDDVCTRAANPISCKQVLQANPGVGQPADLVSLGMVAIDKAQAFSNSALDIATTLAKTVQDPNIKESLNSCAENFGDAIGSLNDCRESLKKKDKSSLNMQASSAYTDATTCNDDFEGKDQPENLRQATKNVIDTCSALLALSNML